MVEPRTTAMSGLRESFTLIELLTVIVIVIILLSLLLGGLSAAREQARRTRCRSEVNQLVQAWHAYLLEYGRFPANPVATMNSNAVTILRGWPANADNPRNLRFLDIGTNTIYLCDPWGVQNTSNGAYRVALDTNLDNYITVTNDAGVITNVYVSVGVWSDGRDRIYGTPDDILSWRR